MFHCLLHLYFKKRFYFLQYLQIFILELTHTYLDLLQGYYICCIYNMSESFLVIIYQEYKYFDHKISYNYFSWIESKLRHMNCNGIGNKNKIIEVDFNSLNAELNPICYFLALLGSHHILHVSRIRVTQLSIPTHA